MLAAVAKDGQAQPYQFDYGVGEVAKVVLPGAGWPESYPGECVLITGNVQRYACGPACDAAGFVADKFEVVERRE